MPTLVNRMTRRITFYEPEFKPLKLEPGALTFVDTDLMEVLNADEYFQFYLEKDKIIESNKAGVSMNPETDKTSYKKPPANLRLNSGKEKTTLGTKVSHDVKTSFAKA
jgi:hypothetical protein